MDCNYGKSSLAYCVRQGFGEISEIFEVNVAQDRLESGLQHGGNDRRASIGRNDDLLPSGLKPRGGFQSQP